MQIANFGESAIEVTRIVRRIGDAHEAPLAIYNLHFSIFKVVRTVSNFSPSL